MPESQELRRAPVEAAAERTLDGRARRFPTALLSQLGDAWRPGPQSSGQGPKKMNGFEVLKGFHFLVKQTYFIFSS